MPVTWSDAHRFHAPERAVWVGVPIDADERPERVDLIRAALEEAGAEVVPAESYPDAALLAVHDAGLVEFLQSAWKTWGDGGMPAESGQPDVVGYIFPTPGLLAGIEPHVPTGLSARTGAWCFDTMTVVAEGTWRVARGAVDAALQADHSVLNHASGTICTCASL